MSDPVTPQAGTFPSARRDARERAMEILYEAELKGLTPSQVLDQAVIAPDPYASELVHGVEQHQAEHDRLIRRYTRADWTLERMPMLDRIVLRLGIEELQCQRDVPKAVVLDQAVQLAKTFSTDDSGRFVNGMLAAIAKAVRPDA